MRPYVLLIGGSSSVGKTTVSRAIGAQLGWEVVEADRLLPDDPVLNPLAESMEIWDRPPQELVELLVDAAVAASSHLAAQVEDFLSAGRGVVLQGERIHPNLASRFAGVEALRAVFVIESSSRRLYDTLMSRSTSFRAISGPRRHAVAEVDRLYGAWLNDVATGLGIGCVSSQPWESLANRILEHLPHSARMQAK